MHKAHKEEIGERKNKGMKSGKTAKILIGAFATGFAINFLVYILLRIVGSKWMLNMLVPIVMVLALMGTAAGAFLHAKLWKKNGDGGDGRGKHGDSWRFEPWMFVAAAGFFFCMVYNYNLASTYLMPVNGFSLYTPGRLGLHLAAEIVFFLLLPIVFVLPGYYFADVFQRAENPHPAYAAHVVGFLAGGPCGLFVVVHAGPAAGVFGALVLMLLFMFARRPVVTIVIASAVCAIFAYSYRAPRLFFTWSERDYKVIESTWSPYFKLDFLSFEKGHCIAGVYNNLFLYYTCDTPARAHLQVRQIYKQIAKDKEQVLVIGGSLGTALSYITSFQDKMKHAVSVEVDPVVVERSKNEYAHFSAFTLNRPDVETVASEGRAFLAADGRKFDLIFLDGLDNRLFFSPMSLVSVENYMFTREGLASVFDHLSPHGVLTIDLGGTTSEEYLSPFLSGMPANAHYELFWYVVPDRPMVGLALYFIVASKDPAALKAATDHIKSLPSMVYLPRRPETSPALALTDDLPVFERFGLLGDLIGWGFVIACMFAALAWWLKQRRKERRQHSGAPPFPLFAFAALGFVYIFIEFSLVLKNARVFPSGPAFGVVELTAAFVFGTLVSNLLFIRIRRLPASTLKAFGWALAVCAAAALAVSSAGGLGVGDALALSLFGGAACGYFWPLLIEFHPLADRRTAYGIDTLGCMAGGFLFHFRFLNHGFTHTAGMGMLAMFALLAYVMIRTGKERIKKEKD